MSKIITVFGATGNQGGSVIKTILADRVLSKEFKIRGITRDTSKPAAKALAEHGVDMVIADMSSPETIAPAVEGAHTVFLVTNFWESMNKDIEVAQGKAVADAANSAGVQHLIFSSLINVTKASKGRLTQVKHFDSKAEIEDHIRAIGVPSSFVLCGSFMQNFLKMNLNKNKDSGYTLAMVCDPEKAQFPLFDAANDTGKFVKAAIMDGPKGKRILAATKYMTPVQMARDFEEVIGKPTDNYQMDAKTFKSYLPEKGKEELYETMMLFETVGYYEGEPLEPSLVLLDEEPTTWKSFVEANRQAWD